MHYPTAEERLRQVSKAKRKAHADEEARLMKDEESKAVRDKSFDDAAASLKQLVEGLVNTINNNIDTLDMSDGSSIRLEEKFDSQAQLYVDEPTQVDYGKRLPFDVIAECDIRLEVWSPKRGSGKVKSQEKMTTITRTLWFGDIEAEGKFRWYEVGIADNPIVRGARRDIRRAEINEAISAFGSGMATKVVGACHPIDGEDRNNFINQWVFWFAQVAGGELTRDPRNEIPAVKHRT